jgi:hypothetical protein
MKTTFKPLGLVAAVAAASAGYAGIVNAQSMAALADNSGLGDAAIVPYYTTQKNYSTGVSVINTSDSTQVVKIRLRRAVDSMDALDFNVILSPNDVYTGYVQASGEEIRFYSNDNSCTAPAYNGTEGQYFIMPNIYREGAEEGYIEIVGMGAAAADQPISQNAIHAGGIPVNCARVRDNFFPGATPSDYGSATSQTRKGVISSVLTNQLVSAGSSTTVSNAYTDTGNVLKVSYFIKSDETGTEFGNDAVHIKDFMAGASMTNQRFGLFDGDLQGFDYPDLNGGAVFSAVVEPTMGAGERGAYEALRAAIGGTEVINDWSRNTTEQFSVDTDWVVTTPGQYVMTNLFAYLASIAPTSTTTCRYGDPATAYDPATGANCDFRDIPMTAIFTVYDREERGIVVDEGDLVVSPQPPGEITVDVLDQEVNVVQWGEFDVLGAAKTISVPVPAGAQAGWADLAVTQNAATTQAICDFTGLAPNGQPTVAAPIPVACTSTDSPVPLIGFVAWQRNFGSNPDANYGRIIEHSYTVVSSGP